MSLHPEERSELMRRVSPNYVNYYGSTDGGGATALMPDAPEEEASSVGRPVFGARVEIVDEAALIAWCRERLAPYKTPRAVFIVDDLPKSGVGKVLKTELAARLEPL